MQVNPWSRLLGLLPGVRRSKGNVVAVNGDGSYTIATADGATILARPTPGSPSYTIGAGVFVEDGRIVDGAPSLPGITQTV